MASTSFADCSDEDLLALVRQGTPEAFGVLVRRYERELYGYLRRYLGDGNLAEDVFQNTFLQLYTRMGQYELGRPVKPWLYTIATHQAIDLLRRENRHPLVRLDQDREDGGDTEFTPRLALLESRLPGPLEQLQLEERRQLVQGTVARLPDHLRQVVILAYYQGLKYSEIATILAIPAGTVKSRMHTALLKLQEAWSAEPAMNDS